MSAKILYTLTDEAPFLATFSLLPILQTFAKAAGVVLETRDISLAARTLAQFPDRLAPEQRVADDLAELAELVHTPEANIVKLPNISASQPQLEACIRELKAQGYPLPDYPEDPQTAEQREIKARYDRVKGSAVNPVLREGNSDRRAPASVKAFARKHPHRLGAWRADSKTHVAHMSAGDFYGSEKSVTCSQPGYVKIELYSADGDHEVLREKTPVTVGEVIDAAVMRARELRAFYEEQIEDAKAQEVLFSLHLKATMMKVSDPILFGHCVEVFYRPVLRKFARELEAIGFEPNNGIGDLYAKLPQLPEETQRAIRQEIDNLHRVRPPLAMVNSAKGITNLHAPNDVIIDASMPAMIRDGGKMWGPDGELHDVKAVIPDRSYAGVYQVVIDDCKRNGQFDPATMGSVSNVGLMARKAEEYGSHNKTFEIPYDGTVVVTDPTGKVLMEHHVEKGDIWRMGKVKDAVVQDWVKLAVNRARASGASAVFWLDQNRPHDAQLIIKVERYLKDHDTSGLDIRIMAPEEACRFTLERLRAGLDTISVTGNVLRDYLTDLFPILELGTSARMLSIVPLMSGGALFETGAGGSAPRHVEQFLAENHLRWDSLGEFLAMVESLEHHARVAGNPRAAVLARALDKANERYLENRRAPSRKVGELDTRGSHFYLALYWAQALAEQQEDPELRALFAPLAEALAEAEAAIVAELNGVQGRPVDLGGYYWPDRERVRREMRPSPTFNRVLEAFADRLRGAS
ncbi:MAG: isocitrate dehydrogenase, NADP-dependent [Porticoccaceae bacterium]|nr:MAG: isocitrate dehydrogenase, NADP-dependent [Porticoccaceae bacterium]